MDPVDTAVILNLGPHGTLKGIKYANGVSRFANIPYALAPLGARRWEKPTPLPEDHVYGDSEPLDCREFGGVCPQPAYMVNGKSLVDTSFKFSEDCLVVNMWVPPGEPPVAGWPILAWIHGGWLQIGDPSIKDHNQPTQLIAEGGLQAIVVSIAYRLNIFGFLAGEGVNGNFGFWDQRCALEWIQSYAPHFHGDPRRVTLGGLSAGAFSTHVQLNYELFRADGQKPLFNNVWLQSNAIPAQPKTIKEANSQLQNVYDVFGIDSSLPAAQKLDQLRNISADELVKRIFDLEIHTFRAVTDDNFIPSDLIANISSGSFASRFKKRGMRILIGEAETEEVLYSLTNPPSSTSQPSMLRALNNYYALDVCTRLLTLYTTQYTSQSKNLNASSSSDADRAKTLYGIITSDVQVRAPIRILSAALHEGGVDPQHIVRYRVAYRPECTDLLFPRDFGVTHSVDGISWWYAQRLGFTARDEEAVKSWLQRTLVPLVTSSTSPPQSTIEELSSTPLVLGPKQYLFFSESGEIQVTEDRHWDWLMKVAAELSG